MGKKTLGNKWAKGTSWPPETLRLLPTRQRRASHHCSAPHGHTRLRYHLFHRARPTFAHVALVSLQVNICCRNAPHTVRGAVKTNVASACISSREALWGITPAPADHRPLQKYTNQHLRMTEEEEYTISPWCLHAITE